MAISICFPLLIFEPSKDFSNTFMWKVYEKCRMKDRYCQLLARSTFAAVRRPPLYLLHKKERFNGVFGFYDCESAFNVFRMSLEERKKSKSNDRYNTYTLFILSLYDVFYDLPYEYLDELEDPSEPEIEEEKKAIKAEGRELQKTERRNLIRIMQEGEEHGIRTIISADWRKRNLKMIKEAHQYAKTVMIKTKGNNSFDVYSNGELIGNMSLSEAEEILVREVLS